MKKTSIIVVLLLSVSFVPVAHAEVRQFMLGDMDGFSYGGGGSVDDVYVDPDWREWVETEAVNCKAFLKYFYVDQFMGA